MANQDLTVGNPGKVIRKYCLPLFGSVFFQQMYNLADSFVAGRYIGENALAAVGNSYEITLIFLAFAFGCNTGASVVAAQYFGAKEYGKVKTAIFTSLIATITVCAVLTFAGMLFAAPLLRAIQTPASIFEESRTYLQIYTCGLAFVFLYNVANGIFSALGDSKTPFYFLMVSSSANVALDILFVSALKMGVAGIAWATFICQGAACVPAIIVVFLKARKITKVKSPVFTLSMFKEFISVAIPSVLQQGFVAAGNIVIQSAVNAYGAAVVAGYSAAVKMNNMVTACFSTIGSGVANYVSQNLGAGRAERIKEGFVASVGFVWSISAVMLLIYEFLPKQLVQLFLNDSSSTALQTGIDFLRIVAPFYFAPAFKIMCDSFLCGAKRMHYVVFSICLDLGLRACIALLCSSLFHTAFSVWFAWPVGWGIAACVTFVLYRHGMTKVINRLHRNGEANP